MTFEKPLKAVLNWNGFSHQIFYPVATELVKMGFDVFTIEHPYNKFDLKQRVYSKFENSDKITSLKNSSTKVGFPFSHLFDLIWPFELRRYFLAVSFSPHLTLRNLFLKKLGLIQLVVHWNIDYSPVRFQNRFLNFIYTRMDKFSVVNSDIQIDLSKSALTKRLLSYKLNLTSKNFVIPVGTTFKSEPELEAVPTLHFVFLGKFNWNQDIDLLMQVFSDEKINELDINLHLIGDGENFSRIKNKYSSNKIIFYGNKSQSEIDLILRKCHIGLAPYVSDPKNFTSFADPSKIKKYSEFALPLIMTDIPPNSKELSDLGVALVGPCNYDFFKSSVLRLYLDTNLRKSMSSKSKIYCKENDWQITLQPLTKFIEDRILDLNKN